MSRRAGGAGRRARIGLLGILPTALALSGCESFRPEWVDNLTLSPDSVHISAGQTATFVPTPYDDRGNELFDRAERVEWTLSSGGASVVGIETAGGSAQVQALALGNARLTARLGRGVARADVYVQPPGLARIEIEPARLEIGQGQRPTVRARLYDAAGDELDPAGFRISWRFVDTAIGFVGTPVGASADLLARRVGTTQLILIVGPLSTSIPFIVR